MVPKNPPRWTRDPRPGAQGAHRVPRPGADPAGRGTRRLAAEIQPAGGFEGAEQLGGLGRRHAKDRTPYRIVPGAASLIANAVEVGPGSGTVDPTWEAWNQGLDRLWAQRTAAASASVQYLPKPLRRDAYELDKNGRWERVPYKGREVMMAGGASLAPRRWSLEALATAARISGANLCTARMAAAQNTRNWAFMLKKLKVYAGEAHPHEAQKPETLDV